VVDMDVFLVHAACPSRMHMAGPDWLDGSTRSDSRIRGSTSSTSDPVGRTAFRRSLTLAATCELA